MYLKKLFSCIMNVSNKFYIKQYLSYHFCFTSFNLFTRNILIIYALHFIIYRHNLLNYHILNQFFNIV